MMFDMDDIEGGSYPHLNEFLETWITQFYVEFLQQGGAKPHVVFHLNNDRPIRARRANGTMAEIKGCLIGMEYTGPGVKGVFTIKLITYHNSSRAARAAFQFPLGNNRLRVMDLVANLRGQVEYLPREHQSDLTRFDFVTAPNSNALDGCRDAVSQWMIRLHSIDAVGWVAIGQGVGDIVFEDLGYYVPTNNFHHIIGNNFTTNSEQNPNGTYTCYITPMPLHRGTFRSSRVHRIEIYGTAELPYHPLPARGRSSRSHR